MDLLSQYAALRHAATQQLAQGRAEPDSFLDDPADPRRGLTLLAFAPAHVITTSTRGCSRSYCG